MKEKIIIEDGEHRKCPFCNTTYAIENDTEVLYKNISMVYIDKAKSLQSIICRQCRNLVEIKT